MCSSAPATPQLLPTELLSSEELTGFLESVFPRSFFPHPPTSPKSPKALLTAPPRKRPFVTLTYAQSLDGKIAGPGGKQIRLSGDESMRLTHRLREIHDSILVGVGTMISDDPQLNARLPVLLPLPSQPQPIILDTNLRTPTSARLMKNYHMRITPRPIILCEGGEKASAERKEALEASGATVKELEVDEQGRLSLESLLKQEYVGQSLMVEGGASVISTFLASGLVDLVVMTIAPVLIGDGVSMLSKGAIPPELRLVARKTFGHDIVIVCRPVQRVV
ncbi:dihydrofolate reductase-like domain-containing protein [Leucosporidium creatinivorum]|uniref:2,5-diamino-6-ribosylamino-4(3H)-pyrimidinone 5'-phosphate reductase n=1 Tax=Leucosporidium creatinivorum TaxID=106004 RepID=A0A1Y2EMK9_9BASI|nr:dihydrofolate reductase-like domain-containing protein [Leucosporidium creatinivorum]